MNEPACWRAGTMWPRALAQGSRHAPACCPAGTMWPRACGCTLKRRGGRSWATAAASGWPSAHRRCAGAAAPGVGGSWLLHAQVGCGQLGGGRDRVLAGGQARPAGELYGDALGAAAAAVGPWGPLVGLGRPGMGVRQDEPHACAPRAGHCAQACARVAFAWGAPGGGEGQLARSWSYAAALVGDPPCPALPSPAAGGCILHRAEQGKQPRCARGGVRLHRRAHVQGACVYGLPGRGGGGGQGERSTLRALALMGASHVPTGGIFVWPPQISHCHVRLLAVIETAACTAAACIVGREDTQHTA